jgi:hypothetical protein
MREQREKDFTKSVGHRLVEFACDTLRLSPKQLSETLGCDLSMVYRIKRGETLPDVAKMVALWSFARTQGMPLNLEWLLTGQASLGMLNMPSDSHFEAIQILKKLSEDDVESILPVLTRLSNTVQQ